MSRCAATCSRARGVFWCAAGAVSDGHGWRFLWCAMVCGEEDDVWKRLSVAVRMLAALSLALSMLAALAVTTTAAPDPSGGTPAEWHGGVVPPLFGAASEEERAAASSGACWVATKSIHGTQEVYFPAVGNADSSVGLGETQTSITVQNLSVDDAYIFVYVGTPEDDDGVDRQLERGGIRLPLRWRVQDLPGQRPRDSSW